MWIGVLLYGKRAHYREKSEGIGQVNSLLKFSNIWNVDSNISLLFRCVLEQYLEWSSSIFQVGGGFSVVFNCITFNNYWFMVGKEVFLNTHHVAVVFAV